MPIRLLVTLLTALLLVTSTAHADERPPEPSQDAFYTPPSPLPGKAR